MGAIRKSVRNGALAVFLLVFLFCGIARAEETDYSDPTNWVLYNAGAQKTADVFLIGQTVCEGTDGGMNMGMDWVNSRKRFAQGVTMQKGLYSDVCAVYAPYYRQATLKAYYDLDFEQAQPYFDIAYEDIRAAFRFFLDHVPEDRPLIVAGFSQGAQMALMLLKEFMADESVRNRLVAAYLIGWRVTDDDLEEAPWLLPAKGRTDTGVFISYNTEAPSVVESVMVPKGVKTYSINPLNWRTDSRKASASLNLGACFVDGYGEIYSEIPNLTGAYLDPERGTLKATNPENLWYEVRDPGIYHHYDFMFFYHNLQENVALRMERYLADHGMELPVWQPVPQHEYSPT